MNLDFGLFVKKQIEKGNFLTLAHLPQTSLIIFFKTVGNMPFTISEPLEAVVEYIYGG